MIVTLSIPEDVYAFYGQKDGENPRRAMEKVLIETFEEENAHLRLPLRTL
jgi:hypothetical protein